MLVEFQTHPDGAPVTVNTRQVTTVRPDAADPGLTHIRFSDGQEVVVVGAKDEVLAKLDSSNTIRNPKRG